MSWSLHVIPVPHDPRELTAALGLLREHLAPTLAQSHGARNHRDCPERWWMPSPGDTQGQAGLGRL